MLKLSSRETEKMGHYRSNLRDIEFNLFEVHRIQDQLGHPPFSDLDEGTMRAALAEVERLARSEWAASFVVADRTELVLEDGEVKLPDEIKASLAALRDGGWDRFGLPEELGGFRVPRAVFWAVQEMLLGANPTAVFYVSGSLFAGLLHDEGTPEQQQMAALMIERGWAGSMVLTEPDAGSDVGAGTTRAVHVEGDMWHLEGVKRFITGGEHDGAENIIHLVLARPVGAGPGTKGLSLFMVPKWLVERDGSLGERNGIYATRVEDKMGLKGSTTCELTLGAGRPCVGFLVGGVHDGIRQMFRVVEHARMMIGTKSAATMSTGYLNALAYATERVQGADLTKAGDKSAPRVPIIRHPDVRRMLMEQKATAEGLRALVSYTAAVQGWAETAPDDLSLAARRDLLLPLVKGYASEKAYEVLSGSLQILGGSGYTQDYPLEQYIRDSKIDTVYEGTTGIQALDLFFRKIARDQGRAVQELLGEIRVFAKGGPDDELTADRDRLVGMLDDIEAHLGVMVDHLMASLGGDADRIYSVGLHTNALLSSLAELVVSWQLLRHAEVALTAMATATDERPFYEGKLAAARWFSRHSAPQVTARRADAEAEDGSLMLLEDAAF
jgi:alkylation response protein AidB-like acyl-CoA dehydrogenase